MDEPTVIAGVTFTAWKLVGYCGALMFAGRWFVHLWYRTRTGSAAVPTVFWIMSLVGAGMTSSYFIWGKNDSVGIIQNVMPMTIALWNLWLDISHRRRALPPA
jgi:lipid-A-disaccharide synthase-like uncharacterized protein